MKINPVKTLAQKFNDKSLRFKITTLYGSLCIVLLLANFSITSVIMQKEFDDSIAKSSLLAIKHSADNLETTLKSIMESMVEIKSEVQSMHFTYEMAQSDDYIENHIKLQALYNKMASKGDSYQYIYSMLVLGKGNIVHSFVQDKNMRVESAHLFEKVQALLDGKSGYVWTGVLSDAFYYGAHRSDIISIIAPIKLYGDTQSVVVINLSANAIKRFLRSFDQTAGYVSLQLEGGGSISSAKAEEEYQSCKDALSGAMLAPSEQISQNGRYIFLKQYMPVSGWNLTMVLSKQELRSKTAQSTGVIIYIFIATAAASMLLSAFIGKSISKPINKLTKIMSAVDGANLDKRFYPKYADEVGALASTFNRMMDDINRLTGNVVYEQEQNRISSLKLLQMQIKPHFLYNSLESARFLVQLGDQSAADMIQAISQYYKLTLSGVAQTSTVGEELEQLNYYLQILKFRYSSKFDYQITAQDGMDKQEIVKLTLQPIVENSVYHGIKAKRGKGFISIDAFERDGFAVIEVFDDGIGMSEQAQMRLSESLNDPVNLEKIEAIGLCNVHQRLALRYGAGSGISIESQEGECTRVTVRIPMRRTV